MISDTCDTPTTPTEGEVTTANGAQAPTVTLRNTADCKPHWLNAVIYGNEMIDNDLLRSIMEGGIHTPLLITEDGTILSGHRRHEAAVVLGIHKVPVIVVVGLDELAQKRAILEANRQRHKTNEQVYREYGAIREIETARAKERQATNQGAQHRKTVSPGDKGKARDKAAQVIDRSAPTADKGLAVVQAIDRLRKSKKADAAEGLRTTLNEKGAHPAFNHAVEKGFIKLPEKTKESRVKQKAKTDPIVAADGKSAQTVDKLPPASEASEEQPSECEEVESESETVQEFGNGDKVGTDAPDLDSSPADQETSGEVEHGNEDPPEHKLVTSSAAVEQETKTPAAVLADRLEALLSHVTQLVAADVESGVRSRIRKAADAILDWDADSQDA